MSFLSEVQLYDKFGPLLVFQEDLGFIPNLVRAQSLLPRVIEAQASLERAVCLAEGEISRVQKERILLSVAAARHDTYCMAAAGNALSTLGVSDRQIAGLLSDYRRADLSAADVALLDFSLKLNCHAPSVRSEDIDRLRAHGFVDESIIEAVATIALAIYRCTLSAGLGPDPDFRPVLPLSETISATRVVLRDLQPGAHQAVLRKVPYVSAPYLSPKSFAPFSVLFRSHGFIPNLFRTQTLRPDLLAAETAAVAAVLIPEDILTRVQKECILLAVSAANLNSYCVAAHCNLLRGLGMPPEDGDQISVDHHKAAISESDKALLDFAVKLGSHHSEFSRGDVDRLRSLGFTEEQILECEVVTAFNNFLNALQMGLGIVPDFEPPFLFQQNKADLSAVVGLPVVTGSVVAPSATAVEDPDARLVMEAQAGSLEAFEELIRRHGRLVYRTLVAILGNPDDAQDAMQDALLNAFKNLAGFQGRSKFSTWLVSIARNAALQRLRDRKGEESLDEGAIDEDAEFRPRQVRTWQDNPEQFYSRVEIRQLVETGIMGLPAKYRIVVMLRDIEQLSTDEVARQTGLSVPAVKVRLLRGRLMLREWLSPHFALNARR
jgi:RNA polymerase sigma-70 factor, ECF subfamily